MASHFGSSQPSWEQAEDDVSRLSNLHQTVLAVAPLNCIPYSGPALSSNITSSPSEVDPILPIQNQPAMVFLSSQSTEDEWKNVLAATRHGVGVTGSAAQGQVGRALGLIDIGESDNSFVFRVSLPGVPKNEKFRCNVEPSGKISITGVTATGEERVCRNSMVFEMQSQNLSPPGEFSLSFQLPGPVNEKHLIASFGNNGIFEGIVKKK